MYAASPSFPVSRKNLLRLSVRFAALLLGGPVVALPAQGAPCDAVSASDVAPIVGSAAMKASPRGCSWKSDNDHWVMILDNTPRSTSMPVPAMFDAAKAAAARDGKVADEPGLGDKAFLAISSSGVAALQVLKGGRLLQVQASTGAAPSEATLALLRKIAARAVAAF
jgi:hypothetical protein